MAKRVSLVWTKLTDEEFVTLFHSDASVSSILLHHIGLPRAGSSSAVYQKRCEQLGLDYSVKVKKSKNDGVNRRTFKNEEVFVENSTLDRGTLKKRILSEGIIPYLCEECEIGSEWNGKTLRLQLEHKNGVNNDNRIENLCFLCPNCHSQTETFAGRNARKPIPKCDDGITARL